MAKIDVHHHVYSPVFTEALEQAGGDPSGWYVPTWTLDSDGELCKTIGVRTAILSHTAPGPEVKSDPIEAASLARQLNVFSAKIRNDDPEHYGFFASVPSMLDTERCVIEIRYALDELKADGIVLMSRYGPDNHYLGHPDLIPVWEELRRHQAVVFVHPTHAVDKNLVNASLPQPMMDYPHETARAAIDLITSNMLREHAADCKIILSHGGGTLAMLVGRLAGLQPVSPFGNKSAEQIREEVGWFYFDTALCSAPEQLLALQSIAKPGHILFGSDFPNAPVSAIRHFTEQLDRNAELSEVNSDGINGGTGRVLFPRLDC
ncbi:hypothetical protein Q7P37_006046 [Cladosporium fusiforme]